MTVTADFSLGAILCNSTIPAVDKNGVAPHYRVGEQEVWTSSGGGGPTIINLSEKDSESLSLTGSCAKGLDGQTMTCSSTWEGFTKGLRTPTTTHEFQLKVNDDGSFKIDLPVSGNKVPWGYKGRVIWTFRPTDAWYNTNPGTEFAEHTTDIELYAISSLCSNDLAKDGIPLDMLRFFVLTTRGDGFYVTNFAAHVVTQIFYHSGFTYNTADGTTRYSPSIGQYFPLTRWLKDLERNKTAVVKNTINCIDLANIVGMTVSLCLKDSEDADALWWSEMTPFGFLKETYLIGYRDKVNNPFTEKSGEYIQKMAQTDTRRQPFRRHWFIVWHKKVYDATSGPQLGVCNIDEYLAEALDPIYDKKGFKSGTSDNFSYKRLENILTGAIAEHEVTTEFDKSWVDGNKTLHKNMTDLHKQKKIGFEINTLVKTLDNRCGNEYRIEPAEPFDLDIHSGEPTLGNTFLWPIRCEHKGVVGRFDLQITIFDTAKQATDKGTASLNEMSLVVQGMDSIVFDDVVFHRSLGTDSVDIFWSYRNLFVNLLAHGLSEDSVMPVAKQLQTYHKEVATKSHAPLPVVKSKAATTSNGSPLPETMAINTTVDVYIEVRIISLQLYLCYYSRGV